MQISEKSWLDKAKHVPSPFFDYRPENTPVSLLVVHNISLPPGQFGGPYIEQLFTGKLNPQDHAFFEGICKLRVSAHCLIRRDGSIVQFVPFCARAWHAGVSQFADKPGCNDYSVGIEMEGTDFVAYTKEQYHALVKVTVALMEKYPEITLERITGHQYIAPSRKTDPGLSFDWRYYHSLLKHALSALDKS
ncbi:1,6-anhydro-N-acetylmuramyl-L-alanine amidase AmpD [Vibrio sp. Of7-15]|uniref:1,6-anhydro-N-acetylmuramyl-L-alanine amidase AmpD n=1 Tax=Vibrio sp. Of7-15 TaxID=2724879 RepID=UPI001EF396EF|nr:1,6-anhydro-N-acetylmuramyl-L-alanine amidase AmpD [Vibrio sp. Of7-15]MCG7498162.1 1,6-anhydro-N-acetylmuramyl-L-alanine amidase AmpD [Vibrio sp. Of7-15]